MSLNVEFSRFQTGADFVAAKNELDRYRNQMPAWTEFLVIDDSASDAAVLRGVLHSWLGHDVEVRSCVSLGTALDQVALVTPDVIFLDHLLPPQNDAGVVMQYLRDIGYDGPIVVTSGMMARELRGNLVKAGAFDALHKDDINSMSVGSILLRIAGIEIDL